MKEAYVKISTTLAFLFLAAISGLNDSWPKTVAFIAAAAILGGVVYLERSISDKARDLEERIRKDIKPISEDVSKIKDKLNAMIITGGR